MARRLLTASLTLVLGFSGLLMPAPAVLAAPTEGLYLSADMSMTPAVVHYRDNRRFDTSAVGALSVDAAAPCAGTCRLTIEIYAPGNNQPWDGYESTPNPGDSWSNLDLAFNITRSMNPTEGANRIVAKLYDSSDALIDTLEVTSLTIYKKLYFVPKLVALKGAALEGRDVPFKVSVSLRYADGFGVSYFGRNVYAAVQWSDNGSTWRTLDHTKLTQRNPSKRFAVQVWKSGRYRLLTKGEYPNASSKPDRVKVWAQTKQARITRDSVSSNEVFRGRSVTVRGSVVAKYRDGQWHSPVPGTRYQVQYRNEGSSRWYTKHVGQLRDKSFAYTFKPRTTGFVRFKVLGKTSDVHRIRVKPPVFDHVWVRWPRGFYAGESVAFPSCAVSNTGTGLKGVGLVLQWRSSRLNSWTTKDRGVTRKNGCVYLVDPRARGGYFRVSAPTYGKAKTRLYS